jgi:CBS domain-containing protein
MTQVVITAGADDALVDALSLMEENRISVLPIVDARRRCVGILSATDLIDLTRELDEEISDLGRVSELSRKWLIRKLIEHESSRHNVASRMTSPVASIGPEATLVDAARDMLRHRVHHLPVVDDEQRLVGIVSTMDLLSGFVDDLI